MQVTMNLAILNRMIKKYKKVETIVRGFSNHRRIQILDLLDKNPELSVLDISEELKINYKTASDHIRKLSYVGLVTKKSNLNEVKHKLTPNGKAILVFCRTLEQYT